MNNPLAAPALIPRTRREQGSVNTSYSLKLENGDWRQRFRHQHAERVR